MEKRVLEKIPSPNLRAYVVWLPVLGRGHFESAAQRETRRVADRRASHFLDRDAGLGRRYGPIIHLPHGLPAWDVYFVFGPSVRWSETPPAPTYWMHQLGRSAPSELGLDADHLAVVVTELLGVRGHACLSSTEGDERRARRQRWPVPFSAFESCRPLSPRNRFSWELFAFSRHSKG